MTLQSWIRNLFHRPVSRTIRKALHRVRPAVAWCRPRLEALENRLAPATLTVNSTANTANPTDPYLSLREAIAIVNSSTLPGGLSPQITAQISGTLHGGGTDTIVFDPTKVTAPIVLGGTQLSLSLPSTTATITIDGGSAGVTVNANGASRVFQVDGPNIGTGNNVKAFFTGLTLMGGTADRGGGILNGGTVILNNCTITGNTSIAGNNGIPNGGNGGGLANYGTATLNNCTVSGNRASNNNSGGGLYNSGSVTLTNCTLALNTAGVSGGAIEAQGPVTVTSCTLSANQAMTGGGGAIDNNSGHFTVMIEDSILAGNSCPFGPDVSNAVVSLGHNLVGETDGSSGWVSSDLTGTVANPLKPLLAPLGYYGGPTQTMALLPGSRAIGKGTTVLGVTTDQRGLPLDTPSPDIGAFQFQSNNASLLVVTTTSDSSGGLPSGALSLRQAVNLANVANQAWTITFAANLGGQTITLNGSQLELKDKGGTQTITGPAGGVTINGNMKSRVFQVDDGVTGSFSNLTLMGGNADRGSGLLNLGTATLTNSTISGNSASNNGGGLYNGGSQLTLTNCTVSSNTSSGYGGGLYTAGSFASGALTTLTNCTLWGNSAGSGYYGGGIYCSTEGTTVTLKSCTITNNTAEYGGGVYDYRASLNIQNTILAGNTAKTNGGGPDLWLTDFAGGSYTDKGNNLFGVGWDHGTHQGDIVLSSLTGLGLAPQLGSYGGPTQTLALLPGSMALQHGTAVSGVTADQRGFPLDSPPDIGAFQVQSTNSALLVVNTTSDSPLLPPGGLSLRQAVTLANVLKRATTTITFDPTVFATAQTIPLSPTAGPLDLNTGGTVTITGPVGGVTVSGGGNSRVFQVEGGVTGFFSNLTITGGTANQGGGVLNQGGATLTLTNCTLSSNTASSGGGGGLFNFGTVSLTNCTLSGNTASGNFSGGGLLSFNAKATLINCTVSGNVAGNAGGGLYLKGPAISLTGCTIRNNTATMGSGGGVWLYATNNSMASLATCTVSGNTAGQAGGGVVNFTGKLTLTNSTLSGNAATSSGGGLINGGNSTTTLTNCTLSGNAANGGGGLYNNGTVTLTFCTVSNNNGGNKGGGGLFNASASPRAATLTSTVVAANTNGSSTPSDIGGGVNVLGSYNLIGDGSGGLNSAQHNLLGLPNNLLDPGLAPLAYYGGPTQTRALRPTSPAIRKGTPVAGVTTDQRSFPLDTPLPDIGAFQFQPQYSNSNVPLVVNTPFDASGVPSSKLDLRGAIDLANILSGPRTITFDTTSPNAPFKTAQTITLTAGRLDLNNTSGTVTINGPAAGVTVNGNQASQVFQVGGGVTAVMRKLTITGGMVANGGGLFNSAGATLTLNNCTVSGNVAVVGGGGLANYGMATLNNCTVSGNVAASGGGLLSRGKSYLNYCSVTDNLADLGGGVYNNTTATLTGCTVSSNVASSGGGLWNNGVAKLTSCTLTFNTALGNGGGLENSQDGGATLTNCTLSGNTAGSTGFGNGGGLDSAGSATVTLTACTVSDNFAPLGGGLNINTGGTATLTDTIVAGNDGGDISGPTSGTNNLIGGNPMLAPLGDYGGPTSGASGSTQVLQTMALMSGSPVIGGGIPVNGLTTDERGLPRGTVVDMGAFQTSLVVESTAGSVNTTPAQLTLAGAVSLANQFGGPIAITFDPNVFPGGQTINLSAMLELKQTGTLPIWTITGPAAGVTINGGTNRVFQVDPGVTATLSNLIVQSRFLDNGAGLEDFGTANVTNCNFSESVLAVDGAIEVLGGTLTVNQTKISGWWTGIHVGLGATATITNDSLFKNQWGVIVGLSPFDVCQVSIDHVDLSTNAQAGVFNLAITAVSATLNWWGSSSGPNSTGAARAIGNVAFSPWLGDTQSLALPTPDALGFTSNSMAPFNPYQVTANSSGPGSPNLTINGAWQVTPTGKIAFFGSGGKVTIVGESGSDSFTLTNAAVTFTANDAFQGATIQFHGPIDREVAAGPGTVNNFFEVSGLKAGTGKVTLSAPPNTGTVSATKTNAGYTLTSTALSSGDGMTLTLSGISTANLTTLTTKGNPVVIVNATGFQGVANLTVNGTGNAVLIGGAGSNSLTNLGTGFNILIGGAGISVITGNGNDILISGTTKYDANVTALDAILSVWSGSGTYVARINDIKLGQVPGGFLLGKTTVLSNGKANTLTDSTNQPAHQNWFLFFATDNPPTGPGEELDLLG